MSEPKITVVHTPWNKPESEEKKATQDEPKDEQKVEPDLLLGHDLERFRSSLQKINAEFHITYSSLTRVSGNKESRLNMIAIGRIQTVYVSELRALAEAIGVSVEDILKFGETSSEDDDEVKRIKEQVVDMIGKGLEQKQSYKNKR